jgi:hypothetical protein
MCLQAVWLSTASVKSNENVNFFGTEMQTQEICGLCYVQW